MLLCGAVGLLTAYIALVGSLGDDFSRNVTYGISVLILILLVFALAIGLLIAFVSLVTIRRTSNRTVRSVVALLAEVLISLTAIFLLFLISGIGIAILQLSTGQVAFGTDEETYRHIIIISAYGGAACGIHATWLWWKTHRMPWGRSFGNGMRVFLETAFIAYAGLWLAKDAFMQLLKQLEVNNVGFVLVASVGLALICVGSFSLMSRQSNLQPSPEEHTPRSIRADISSCIGMLKDVASAAAVWARGIRKP